MRLIDKVEAVETAHSHPSDDGRNLLVEPHPKWSRELCEELCEELLEVAKKAVGDGHVHVVDAVRLTRVALRAHLCAMADRRELVEWNDGKWYRDRAREIAAENGDRFTMRTVHTECGGPSGHCDCALEIRDRIRSIAIVPSDERGKC